MDGKSHTPSIPSSFRSDCLQGRVALITGGGSGICKGIAKVFMDHGAHVAILSRSLDRLQRAAIDLEEATGGQCLPVRADIRSAEQVGSAVDAVLARFGAVDILVNGAAGNFLAPLEKLSIKGFKTVLEIDALGMFTVSKIVFHKCFQTALKKEQILLEKSLEAAVDSADPSKAENQRDTLLRTAAVSKGKVIINISMTLHYTGALLQTHAGAAKAAVDAMTKHMAVEWGPYNIRVNAVAPGPVAGTVGLERINPSGRLEKSKATQTSDTTDPQTLELLRRLVPLQRIGQVQDTGFACLFLCLPEASLVTGATLVVDGGQWLCCNNLTLMEPKIQQRWREAPFASNL